MVVQVADAISKGENNCNRREGIGYINTPTIHYINREPAIASSSCHDGRYSAWIIICGTHTSHMYISR